MLPSDWTRHGLPMMVSCGSGTQLDDIGYKCFSGGYKKNYQFNNTFDTFLVKPTEYNGKFVENSKIPLAPFSHFFFLLFDAI